MSNQAAATMLRYVSAFLFLSGLPFVAGAFADMDGLLRQLLDFADFPVDGDVALLTQEARLLSAIAGGLTAGLAVMFFTIVAPAVARGDREAARGAIVGMLTWFVLDSAGSVGAGVTPNVVFNAVFLALLLVPLVASGRATSVQRALEPD